MEKTAMTAKLDELYVGGAIITYQKRLTSPTRYSGSILFFNKGRHSQDVTHNIKIPTVTNRRI